MKRKRYKRKQHFFFGETGNYGCLYLRKSFSNIFVTFTDMNNKVIICKTSGNSGILDTKRRKKNPQALEVIIKELMKVIKIYRIRFFRIIFKMRFNNYTYNFIRLIKLHGLIISQLEIHRSIAFNGVRGRKLRRV